MPLRDMTLLCADQVARDAISLFGPRPAAKTKRSRKLAAVENGVRGSSRRSGEVRRGNWRHARRAPGERRLRGNDTARKTMPSGHAPADIVIRAPHALVRCKTRCDREDRRREIGRGGRTSMLI